MLSQWYIEWKIIDAFELQKAVRSVNSVLEWRPTKRLQFKYVYISFMLCTELPDIDDCSTTCLDNPYQRFLFFRYNYGSHVVKCVVTSLGNLPSPPIHPLHSQFGISVGRYPEINHSFRITEFKIFFLQKTRP